MTAARYSTTPCRTCHQPVVLVSTRSGDGMRWVTVPLDPAARIYTRESDGEGGGVWTEWVDRTAVMARHVCRGST